MDQPQIEVQALISKHRIFDYFSLSNNFTLISFALMALLAGLFYRFGFQVSILGSWVFITVASISISIIAGIGFRKNKDTIDEKRWFKLIHLLGITTALPWVLLPWFFLGELRAEVLLVSFAAIFLISTGVFFVPANFTFGAIGIGLIFTSFSLRCLYPANELGFYAAILATVACAIMLFALRGLHLNYLHQIEITFVNRWLTAQTQHANEAKLEFLSSASHDLRQPVYSLSILLDTFSKQYKHLDKKLIRLMTASLGSMQSMLSSLLEYSKLEAGVVTPMLMPVNLNELVIELKAEFAVQLKQSGNELFNNTGNVIIQTDPTMLGSILRNLLSNAIQHSANSCIKIESKTRDEQLLLSVCDQGHGISSQHQDQIFNAFFRLKSSTNKFEQGVGLGLSIIKRLCTLLAYEISLKSSDKGTCFTVRIPISQQLK